MLNRLVKSALYRCGLEVHRARKPGATCDRFLADPFRAQKTLLEGMEITTPTIFDIGAYVGATVERYRARFPGSRIYCFEPSPGPAETLVERYSERPEITVVPMAVADKPGDRTLYVNEFDATNSLLPRPSTARRYYPRTAGPKTTMQVAVTTIDEFVSKHGVETVHILKLDIQGGELMALQGATHTLRDGQPPLVYTETQFVPHYEGNPLLAELWTYLAGFGYTLFDIYNLHRATNGQLRYGDALFISESLRKRVVDKYREEP